MRCARGLVVDDATADQLPYLLLVDGETVAQGDERNHLLSVDRVGHADDTSLEDCRMVIQASSTSCGEMLEPPRMMSRD
jgi:hypothetical protein